MHIGVNPLIWNNDDEPALGGDVPLERCLAEAREAGFPAIELGGKFPRAPRALRPLLARHRLRLISGWYGARLIDRGAEREHESMRPHVALLRAMKCTTMIFGEVSGAIHRDARPLSQRPVLDPAAWSAFVRELDLLARRMRGEGIQLAYHHHMGTVVQTPTEIARLLEDTSDAVGLLLDTGHLAWGLDGAAPAHRWAQRFAKRVVHVHLKDVRREVLAWARAGDASFLDGVRAGVFTVPGDGDLALAPVLSALRDAAFDGWVVVEAEQDPELAHPLTYAKLGFANATRLIAACAIGVRRDRRAPRTATVLRARRYDRGRRARSAI